MDNIDKEALILILGEKQSEGRSYPKGGERRMLNMTPTDLFLTKQLGLKYILTKMLFTKSNKGPKTLQKALKSSFKHAVV